LKNWTAHLIKISKFMPALLRVGIHRSEFEHLEWFAMFATTRLREDRRARGSHSNQECDDQHHRRKEYQPDQRTEQIDASFDQEGPRYVRGGSKYQHRLGAKDIQDRTRDRSADKFSDEP